jgi:hypothetical protein
MKTTHFSPFGRRGYLLLLNLLLTIGFTVLSFRYVQPKDCYSFCGGEQLPCPTGSCRFGEQKAGWPFTVFVDNPGGGSPTGGWGLLGPEDPPLVMPMLLTVLFYSMLVWLVIFTIGLIRNQMLDPKLILLALPMNVLLAAVLWGYGWYPGFDIGRGHRGAVDVASPTSTYPAMGFSPNVSIPLEELIGKFGDPDDVWFTSSGSTEDNTTGMLLYWNSINVFVELPQVAKKTYAVHKGTDIEKILFFVDGQDVTAQNITAVEGKPLSAEKIAWTGYGNYQP